MLATLAKEQALQILSFLQDGASVATAVFQRLWGAAQKDMGRWRGIPEPALSPPLVFVICFFLNKPYLKLRLMFLFVSNREAVVATMQTNPLGLHLTPEIEVLGPTKAECKHRPLSAVSFKSGRTVLPRWIRLSS